MGAKQSTPRAIFGCRQCIPDVPNADCACLEGEYCVKDESSGKQGTCQSYEGDVLGQSCMTDAPAGHAAFCGKINSHETLKGAMVNVTEWVGRCNNHVCERPDFNRAKQCTGQ